MSNKIKLNTERYNFFVFDCDGVLIDSNELKSLSFAKTLEEYPKNLINDFLEYHSLHGGVSRYIKFDYFFSEMLGMRDYKNELNVALKKFSEISNRMINERAELIPGIIDFLSELSSKNKKTYVCSGSDQKDLRKILANKGMDKFFDGIYGSPRSKSDILSHILMNDDNLDRGLFFGDAFSDYEAATSYKMDFIYVSFNSEWINGGKISQSDSFKTIFSFKDIKINKL